MQGMVVGVFCARDAMLFYFWEAMLIPMYLSIGIWVVKIDPLAIKFNIYTFVGSALMLVALLYLFNKTGTFNIESWYLIPHLSLIERVGYFWLSLAFAIKIPMAVAHLVAGCTHRGSAGSVVLAAQCLS